MLDVDEREEIIYLKAGKPRLLFQPATSAEKSEGYPECSELGSMRREKPPHPPPCPQHRMQKSIGHEKTIGQG